MKQFFTSGAIFLLLLPRLNAQSTSTICVQFKHYANGRLLQQDSSYNNQFGENFSIHKLKYYVSNFSFNEKTRKNVQLIDAFGKDSFVIKVVQMKPGNFSFTLGIDSIWNVSGAQSGALDPLNDMFWTWHTGYVYFKLEGSSNSSKAPLEKIQFHIGGYKKPFIASRRISIPMQQISFEGNKIIINVHVDNIWRSENARRFAQLSSVMQPGKEAMQIADCLPQMFGPNNRESN